jgi:hypothetical protein
MTDDQIIAVAKVVRNGGHWDQLDIINFGRLIAAAAKAEEREACCQIVYGYCGSDNVAARTVEAIKARGT